MSTVLPDEPLDELLLPELVVLLLLLLQPTTARATAARAAIAGVRLIYLPLVDVKDPAVTRREARRPTGLGYRRCDSRGSTYRHGAEAKSFPVMRSVPP